MSDYNLLQNTGLDLDKVDAIIRAALSEDLSEDLKEDLGKGDITTLSILEDHPVRKAEFIAKQRGVIAGLPIAGRVFGLIDGSIIWNALVEEGADVEPGIRVATIEGPVLALLSGERTALNFVQRLSGIATLTNEFVKAVSHTEAKILDTRKTAPGLRILDKYAVKTGGGTNHRQGLFDGILLKDNHIALAGGITEAIELVRQRHGQKFKIEVETKTLDQVEKAVSAGADIIMLDNMDTSTMVKALEIIDKKALVEASGGVNLETVAEIASTGVDFISVGGLTHSAPALDVSMDMV